MKISYNWLSEYISTGKTPAQISEILTDIGLEVESVEKVQAVPGGLTGLIIGQVTECIPHPNADRLRVTKVFTGTGNDLQIVCGAPNVASGQKVIVALPGTTIYPLEGDPFTIKSSKIRGEVSEGMLCAEDEISLGPSHDGILVLDSSAPVGLPAKDWFKLADDFVFEIGLTPNRADAASHLGVARDLAAYLRVPFNLPKFPEFITHDHTGTIPVIVENENACPRYSSLTISGLTVQESPSWLKDRLSVIGLRSINNIVDCTNYVLHGLGQPLHAFDADQIAGGKVVVRNCIDKTPFTTLDGSVKELSDQDLMICDAEKPMCIAGVFGGLNSGITASTTSVFLESACFDPVSIRKTSKRHALKTDASFRFERGTDPEMTVIALKYAARLIVELAGGSISSEISDFYPVHRAHKTIAVRYANVSRLIGKQIPAQEIKTILSASGITILSENDEEITVTVPPFKIDVTREADIIEEILRLYGYNNIEIPTQVKASLNNAPRPDPELVRTQVADLLAGNGFYEILCNSLTSAAFTIDEGSAVTVLNPLSNELDTMRQTLLYSGLEAIAFNQRRKSSDLKFFEFGKVYHTEGEGFRETPMLSIFLTGSIEKVQWNTGRSSHNFYNLKSIVDNILKKLNINNFTVNETVGEPFAYGLEYRRGDKLLVSLGLVSNGSASRADVTGEVFYAAMHLELLIKAIRGNRITAQDIPKFPMVRRDLSLLVDRTVTFADLEKLARRTERALLKDVTIFDVYEGANVADNRKSYALSFTLQDEEKTLTDKQIDTVMQKIISTFEKEAGVEIRK